MDSQTKGWIENFAKVGYAAKGMVYFLVGSLTARYALDLGGEKASNTDALNYLFDFPGGSFLLGLLAAGLVCYSIWKFIEGFKDTKHQGSKPKGLAKRISYVFSGLIYGSLAFVAFKIMVGKSQSSGGGDKQEMLTAQLLDMSFGEYLVGLIGLITIGNGLYQIGKGISGSFMKEVSGLANDERSMLEKVGRAGFISRGIVFGIIGFLFLKAAWSHNAEQAGGTTGAFSYLQTWPYGSWLLAAVAIGLMAYGIFMFVQAKYSNISLS